MIGRGLLWTVAIEDLCADSLRGWLRQLATERCPRVAVVKHLGPNPFDNFEWSREKMQEGFCSRLQRQSEKKIPSLRPLTYA